MELRSTRSETSERITRFDETFAKSMNSSSTETNDEGIYEPEDPREWNLPVPFMAVTQTMRPNIDFRGHPRTYSSSSDDEINFQSSETDQINGKVVRRQSKSTVYIDEFGFQIDGSKMSLPTPFTESVENRRNWLVCLEFTYTNRLGVPEELGEMDAGVLSQEESLWSRLLPRLSHSPRLTELIRGFCAADVCEMSTASMYAPDRPVWTGLSGDVSPGGGVPHFLRSKIWPRISGALEKQERAASHSPPLTYSEAVHCSNSVSSQIIHQVDKDLLRTLPSNVCFSSSSAVGIPRLRRVLLAVAWLYTDVGYCQGLGVIAANLLLLMEEESAFWMMCSIIEDILPPSYFSADSLLGVQADQRVLGELISAFLPRLDSVVQQHEIELALITLGWFLTLFAGVLSMRTMLRVWDLLFYEGSSVLFRVALSILKINEDVLVNTKNSASFFNAISAAPGSITDVNELLKVAYSFEEEYLDSTYIDGLRRHHLSQLLSELSATSRRSLSNPLPKQFLSKREVKGRPVIFCGMFGVDRNNDENDQNGELFENVDAASRGSFHNLLGEALCFAQNRQHLPRSRLHYYKYFSDLHSADPKIKNIRQTELLVNLRQSILEIVRHFHNHDPANAKVSSQADYSLASHAKDLAVYVQTAAVENRRAKALEDFARQEADELGFMRNDIISVLDMHDEHCWLGELNGLRGWFPAKLVEILDERSKRYSPAGDDTVHTSIGRLIRQGLCSALRAVFEYGLKRTRGLSDSTAHPWKFIEEVALKEVQRDSSSINSRLVLCRTFRLDEVGKVLSPEELLYRSVHSINASHNASPEATDDVKFRTLVCIGLNELVLHLWLEIFCSCEEIVTKRYHPWSFLRSPGWVQIKCELRVLSQFAFHLYPLLEVSGDLETSQCLLNYEPKSFYNAKLPLRLLSKLRLGVRPLDPSDLCDFGAFKRDTESTGDMLVKYHLFSWEL